MARAFAFKVTEVQTVISENLRNFKSFFRWLYNCIINSSGENGANVPPEQKKFTQEDIDFVCQFIQDNFFHEWTGENPVMFKLERVGQYLSDKPLLYQFDSRNSAWEILKQCGSDVNEHIGDCRPESSLISLELELKQVIQDVVNNVNLVVSESLKLLSAGLLISVEPIDSVKLKCCYGQPGHFQVFATKRTLTNTGEFHRFVMDPLTGAFIAQSVGKYEKLVHSIADFDIYNTETIALLLSKPTIDHHHRFFVAMHKLSPYEISKKAKQHTVEPLVEDWSDELNDSVGV